MQTSARGLGAVLLWTATVLGGCGPQPQSQTTGTGELRAFVCPGQGSIFGVPCTPGLEVALPDCDDGLCPDLEGESCVDCATGCVAGTVCPVNPGQGCPVGFGECTLGTCRDLQTDRLNCGACGFVCGLGQVCADGICGRSTNGCPVGFGECTLGTCRDLRTDRLNCGVCGLACGVSEVCSNGFCRRAVDVCPGDPGCTTTPTVVCPFGFLMGGCGPCGAVCGSGTVCVDGVCVVDCQPGMSRCGDRCADLRTDEGSCGQCGRVCGPGEACIDGACVGACPGGLTRCDGVCVDLLIDEASCGRCGHACSAGTTCVSGMCL